MGGNASVLKYQKIFGNPKKKRTLNIEVVLLIFEQKKGGRAIKNSTGVGKPLRSHRRCSRRSVREWEEIEKRDESSRLKKEINK